jgi:uncharacterized caspase-like protein
MTRLHAVVVGVDRYADPDIPNLRFAAKDARDLAALLRESAFADGVDTYLLTNADATRARVLHLVGTVLARFASADDVLLFYFAGHGSPEVAGGRSTASRFLVCHDTLRAGLFTTGIDVTVDLVRVAGRTSARLVMFVLDACFSGYSGGRGIVGAEMETYRDEHRPGLRLADLDLGSGVAYLSAASDTEVAWENEDLGHGVFSYYFLSELATDGPSAVGLATLYDRVHAQVRSFTKHRQNPVLWGNLTGAALPRLGTG